jgi:single-strand DNA-binding protein
MNEISIHGNVTTAPVLRYRQDSDTTAFLSFTVAVNRGYHSRRTGGWVQQPAVFHTVFHTVVCSRQLAENAAATLKKGTAVTVTGQLADDSYTPPDSDRLIRRQRLEAADIAVSLRWATATITRLTRDDAPTDESAGTTGEATAATGIDEAAGPTDAPESSPATGSRPARRARTRGATPAA